MAISINDSIRMMDQTRWPTPTKLFISQKPTAPTGLTVTGFQGGIRVQWAPTLGVDGYEIAVMTNQNLAAPDVTIMGMWGDKNREWMYLTGNVAVTRYFAIRSVTANVESDWSSIASATSVVYGATESAPPTSPSTSPSGGSTPTYGGTGGGGHLAVL